VEQNIRRIPYVLFHTDFFCANFFQVWVKKNDFFFWKIEKVPLKTAVFDEIEKLKNPLFWRCPFSATCAFFGIFFLKGHPYFWKLQQNCCKRLLLGNTIYTFLFFLI
jgi:hypothetical protein